MRKHQSISSITAYTEDTILSFILCPNLSTPASCSSTIPFTSRSQGNILKILSQVQTRNDPSFGSLIKIFLRLQQLPCGLFYRLFLLHLNACPPSFFTRRYWFCRYLCMKSLNSYNSNHEVSFYLGRGHTEKTKGEAESRQGVIQHPGSQAHHQDTHAAFCSMFHLPSSL